MHVARVLIVDGHEIVRDGLKVVLGRQPNIQLVAEAADGLSALDQATSTAPDLAIVDLRMPDGGLEFIRRLSERFPSVRTIVLSGEADPLVVHGALRLGVRGYVLKGNRSEEVVRAVDAAMHGQAFFSPEVAALVAEGYREAQVPARRMPLSSREIDVLRLLAEGKTSKEIAATLGVGVTTVDTHRHSMMKKLELFSVAELTKYAIREGLTSL
ncbi:MAG TPA: response regulator transcription factor [Vicinamibacterales bacterium]|jgi:DNA-binding NarL/FixJ family response regulator